MIKLLQDLREFLADEVERAGDSKLPKNHPYRQVPARLLARVERRLAAIERIEQRLEEIGKKMRRTHRDRR